MADWLLAVWNDVEPLRLDEYERWHTLEHVPERVSVPGFVAGRRYRRQEGTGQDFLTVYDIRDPAVLDTDRYQALIDDPSNWSRAMRPAMRNFARSVCETRVSLGVGRGASMAVVRVRGAAHAAAAPDAWDSTVRNFESVALAEGVHRVRWLRVARGGAHPLEKAREPMMDAGAEFLGLLESSQPLPAVRATHALAQRLVEAVPGATAHGVALYGLVYQVFQSELGDVSVRPAGRDDLRT